MRHSLRRETYEPPPLPPTPWDGRSLRSRTIGLILKTLAIDVAGSLVAAELYRAAVILLVRSGPAKWDAMTGRDSFYIYLHRLEDRGWIKIDKLKERLTLFLTPRGRRALEEYERHWSRKGEAFEEEAQRLGQAVRDLPPSARTPRPAPASQGAKKAAERSWVPTALREPVRRLLRRFPAPRRMPGLHREQSFVAYDVPLDRIQTRRLLPRFMAMWGFKRLQQSFYIGPTARLKGVVETLEMWGALPYARWGTLSILTP